MIYIVDIIYYFHISIISKYGYKVKLYIMSLFYKFLKQKILILCKFIYENLLYLLL